MRHVPETTVAMEKQQILHISVVCVCVCVYVHECGRVLADV